MSLDFRLYLGTETTECRECFQEVTREIEVFDTNITHNLGKMAIEAGIYDCLWRAPENGFTHAKQLIEPLEKGLELLRSEPERFLTFNPENGWGDYHGFVQWVSKCLEACKEYPEATISTYR